MTRRRTQEWLCWGPLADQPVSSLMHWPVAAVEDTDSLLEVSRILADNEIGAVCVLHNGALVGLVSERDLAARLGNGPQTGDQPGDTTTGQVSAGEVMSPQLVTVPPEAPILDAARIMHEAHVRHLPVVSEHVVAGMVSMRDLFDLFLDHADRWPEVPGPRVRERRG
jgi:CBS domain-containing protein